MNYKTIEDIKVVQDILDKVSYFLNVLIVFTQLDSKFKEFESDIKGEIVYFNESVGKDTWLRKG